MKALDWVDWVMPCMTPEDYRRYTAQVLWSFSGFIHRATNSLCAGDPPALLFDGVPLPSLEQAAGYLMRQRFANRELAAAAGEALAWGYWQHGCACASIVRNGKAGWRVRVIAQ